MRFARKLLAALLVLLVMFGGLVFFVSSTQTGLQFTGWLLQSQLGPGLHIGRLSGRLASAIEVEDLRIQLGSDVYAVKQLQLSWSPLALISGELVVKRLTAESVTLTITGTDVPAEKDISINVELPVAVSLGEASIRSLRIDGPGKEPVVIEQITLSARARDQQLDIDSLQLTAKDYQAGLTGILGLQPDEPSDLHLSWLANIPDEATFSVNGQANISGLLHDYRLVGSAKLSGRHIPAGDWQFSATGDLDGLQISQLNGQTLDGSIAGNVELDWLSGFGWQTKLALKQVNPGLQWPEWPGTLTAQLTSDGRLADKLQTTLQLQQVQGTLRDYPLAGQVDVEWNNERLAIKQLDIVSGDNSINASGMVGDSWDLTAAADLPEVAALLPGWEGALDLSGRIQGEREHPSIDARVSGDALAGPSVAIEALSGTAQLHWSESGQQSLDIRLQGAQLAGQLFDEATLGFAGSAHRHQLSLLADGKDTAMDLQLAGDWTGDLWQGDITRVDWQLPGTGRWSLREPVSASLGAQIIRLPETCWLNDAAQLCVDAQGNPQQRLTPNLRLERFPLQTLAVPAGSSLTLTSLVDATVQASLDEGRVTQADLQMNIGAGKVGYDDPTLPSDSQIRQGALKALLDANGLTANAALDLSGTDQLRAALNLPGYQPGITPWKSQPLEMTASGELQDLLFLKYLLEDVGSYEGSITLNIEGRGTLGQPRMSGGATVSDSAFEIDKLGIRMTNLDLQLTSKVDGFVISGSSDSGKGSVQLNGNVTITDIAHWQADVDLQGKAFEVMHLPEGVIEVSPDLHARIEPPALRLSGELHVPYARLRPKDLSTRAGVSSDVIIVDAKQTAVSKERWQVSSNIRLSLGDDVEIDGYGLKGDILGAVDLLDEPGRATTAQGKLSIERGSYEVYGRELEIQRGQLLFSGGAVDNPGLDFEASRRVENITAGIRARGTLREPELTLFSDPTMGDSDIISYIAFGKPQAEIGQGGGSLTDAGIVAGGNMLAGILGTKVGLEEFGVESGETLDEAAMVLGTYLSPQLYVRYRTGLYDAINEFEVRYEFSRRWSVRTVTSVDNSSAEVQFSFER
jgi:translocation and assembly module TamB